MPLSSCSSDPLGCARVWGEAAKGNDMSLCERRDYYNVFIHKIQSTPEKLWPPANAAISAPSIAFEHSVGENIFFLSYMNPN